MRITRRAFLGLLAASGLRELGGGFADVLAQLDDQVERGEVDGAWLGDVSRETRPPCGAVLDHIATLPCSWRPAAYEPCDACLQAGADGWVEIVAERRTADDLAGMIVAFDLADGWERSITVGRFVPVASEHEIGVECSIDMGIVWEHVRAVDQDGDEWVSRDKGETWARVL